MNKAAGQPGDGTCRLFRLEIDNAPAADGAGLLPRITVRGPGPPEGVLICIGAPVFGGVGGLPGGEAAVPPVREIGA